MKGKKFWNWVKNEAANERILYLDGVIAQESWWGDEVTPAIFRSELFAGDGNVTIWINSPGGDCVAASQIYAMLMDYEGDITVKIDGIAASAASVIAMAGTKVLMAPTAMMMIHNPLTFAIGDSEEMRRALDMLSEFKESIINAYEIKTGQTRVKLSHLMDAETWMNANKAIELKFADGMLEDEKRSKADMTDTYAFSRRAVTNSLFDKVKLKTMLDSAFLCDPIKNIECGKKGCFLNGGPCRRTTNKEFEKSESEPKGITAESLEKRLSLISH
jgi:ATP-dependent Clp protease protease subunit